MELGMIGCGPMGLGMVERLVRAGHTVTAHDLLASAVTAARAAGARGVASIDELVSTLTSPRTVWLMLPAGDPTENAVEALGERLVTGDAIIDGGNSHYRDSQRRAARLARLGITLIDVGVSAGRHGARVGFSLMVGGPRGTIDRLQPVFDALAATPGASWGCVGPSGAGHFVKMIHNGVAYGLMQAYAQGLGALAQAPEFDLDLRQVVDIWRHGAVARSWLLDLTAAVLAANPGLGDLAPYVADEPPDAWTTSRAVAQVAQRGLDRWYRPPDRTR